MEKLEVLTKRLILPNLGWVQPKHSCWQLAWRRGGDKASNA